MKFKTKKEKLKTNEVMADLLLPLKNHANEETARAIELTMWALCQMEVENEGKKKINVHGKDVWM